jgi:hypothetical protein
MVAVGRGRRHMAIERCIYSSIDPIKSFSEIFIKEAQNARENLYEYAVIRVVPR